MRFYCLEKLRKIIAVTLLEEMEVNTKQFYFHISVKNLSMLKCDFSFL